MVIIMAACALLFAVLFLGSFVVAGLQHSAAQLQNYGYNGHYLTLAQDTSDQALQQSAQNTVRDTMDTELRNRGVKMSDNVRSSPEYLAEFDRRLALAISQKIAASKAAFQKRIQASYGATATYHLKVIPALDSNAEIQTKANADPYLSEQDQEITKSLSPSAISTNAPFTPHFYSTEQAMLEPLLQHGQSFSWKPGQPYPVIISYAYLQYLQGGEASATYSSTSYAHQVQSFRTTAKQYAGRTLSLCYRNDTAQQQLGAVLHYNKTANTDNSASTKPIPIATCQGFDQAVLKKADLIATTTSNDPKPLFPIPAAAAPLTQTVLVKIVGFTNDTSGGTDLLSRLLSGVTNWPQPFPAIMPATIAQQSPLLASDGLDTTSDVNGTLPLIFDFANRTDQRKFIATSCNGYTDCQKEGKWMLSPFGNVKVAVENVVNISVKIIKWVALVVSAIAGLMIMVTVSKVIADSRREIAIFQALGARRWDIAQIYFVYGLSLAAGALCIALLLASLGAIVLSHLANTSLQNMLVQSVGAYDTQTHTSLFWVEPVWVSGIALVIFAATIAGVALPLVASQRRSLIKFMREE
jgi:hypothetical protein